MNRTHHILTRLFGLLFLAGGLAGCIREDLSDCPVMPPEPEPEPTVGTLKLALTYKMHNVQENGAYIDLFGRQVRKVDVFVFDEDGYLVSRITDEAAPQFTDNYTKEIELPGGDYRLVVWGNQYDDETTHTCLDSDASLDRSHLELLALTRGSNDTRSSGDDDTPPAAPVCHIPMLTDSLFHGATPSLLTVENGREAAATIDLMKNRNDVRLVVRWKPEGQDTPCTRPEHARTVSATLTDNNARYDFLNRILPLQEPVCYLPGRFHERYDVLFHPDAEVCPTQQEHVYVADFSELRLMKDNTEARLTIRQGDHIVYERGLMELITKIEKYRTQEALDREDRYLIELEFACRGHEPESPDPDSWTAITIRVNGWNLVDRPVDL